MEKIRVTKAYIFILIFLLADCPVSNGANHQAEGKRPVDLQNSVTVSKYCENFAIKYAKNNDVDYQKNSVQTEKEADLSMWISNVFQPSGSKFRAGYNCRFQIRSKEEDVHNVSVSIFLTETLSFAEHTSWKELHIIPIEYVVDEINVRAGYGVFKYLETTSP